VKGLDEDSPAILLAVNVARRRVLLGVDYILVLNLMKFSFLDLI